MRDENVAEVIEEWERARDLEGGLGDETEAREKGADRAPDNTGVSDKG